MCRRWARALAGVALGVGLAFAGAAPADAHAQLVSVTPAAGSTLASAPDEVRLTFDGPPYDYGLGVVVLGPTGNHLETGHVSVVGDEVVQSLRAESASGTYQVQWRVVSADGHPASGTYTFAVGASGRATAPGAAGGGSSSGGGKGWLLLVVAALAVAGLVALMLLPGRRRPDVTRAEGPSA